jgi:hypothetical protein
LLLLLLFSDAMHSQGVLGDQPPGEKISPQVARLIADVRQATAGYRYFNTIADAGYGKFLDCFVNYQIGGMGQHDHTPAISLTTCSWTRNSGRFCVQQPCAIQYPSIP